MTSREAEVMDFIRRYETANGGVSPCYEEIRLGIGASSKSGVHRLVASLIAKKRLRREASGARGLVIVDHDPFDGVETSRIITELRRRGITVASCGECDAVAGSPDAHRCTRTDCGLSDRHHSHRNAA